MGNLGRELVGLAKKFVWCLLYDGSSSNFVRLCCNSCPISAHFLKSLIRIGEFLYSLFSIEDGRKTTFLACCALYLKKSENATLKKRFM